MKFKPLTKKIKQNSKVKNWLESSLKKSPHYFKIKHFAIKAKLFISTYFLYFIVGFSNIVALAFILQKKEYPVAHSQSEATYALLITMSVLLLYVFVYKLMLKRRRVPVPRGKYGF